MTGPVISYFSIHWSSVSSAPGCIFCSNNMSIGCVGPMANKHTGGRDTPLIVEGSRNLQPREARKRVTRPLPSPNSCAYILFLPQMTKNWRHWCSHISITEIIFQSYLFYSVNNYQTHCVMGCCGTASLTWLLCFCRRTSTFPCDRNQVHG